MSHIAIITRITGKELGDYFRDPRHRWLFGISIGLTFCAILFGVIQISRLTAERNASTAMDAQIWTSQGAKNPHAAAHFGQYAFKPWSPLALADPGVSFYSGTAIWVEAHKQNPDTFTPARDRGVASRNATLSLAFVMQKMMPLVIILLAFSTFTRERELGTLRQLLSLGVSPAHLFAGKAISFLILLAALMIPTIVGTMISLWLFRSSAEFPLTDLVGRSGWLAAVYLLYFSGWLALTMGVSARSKSSGAALTLLLAFWIMNSFAVPRIMSDVVKNRPELPSSLEFSETVAERKKQDFGHSTDHPAYAAFVDSVLKTYGVATIQQLPVNMRGLALRKSDEVGYKIYDELFADLYAKKYRQDLYRAIPGVVFPSLAVEHLSMGFSGSDNRAHSHFISEVEKHRRVIQTMASEDLIHNAKYDDTAYTASPELWAKMPTFLYRSEPVQAIVAVQAPVLVVLAGWAIFTALFAVISVRAIKQL
jgi:ABC-2 type transport system permease protein